MIRSRALFTTVVAWSATGCGRFHFEANDAVADVANVPAWPSVALAIDTGASADLTAILAAHASDGATGFSSVGPEVAGVLGSIVAPDAVLWSKPLGQVAVGDPWITLPSDVDVVFAVDGSGTLAAMAVPRGPVEHALAVLTSDGLTTEHLASWGTPAGPVLHPFLGLDRRSNLLAALLFSVYVQEVNGGRLAGTLPVLCSTYGCNWGTVVPGFEQLRFRMYNGFGDTVAVYLSAAVGLQPQTLWGCGCPFDGIAFSASPWAAMYDALNQQWNSKLDPQLDGSITRSFRIAPATARGAFLMALAYGDNQNSGAIAADGTALSQFVNSMSTYEYHREAGYIPSTVTMQITNDWSYSRTELRLAVIGTTLEFDLVEETPSPSGDNNPSPISLMLPPGWTE